VRRLFQGIEEPVLSRRHLVEWFIVVPVSSSSLWSTAFSAHSRQA
jgi:hypothetical protein